MKTGKGKTSIAFDFFKLAVVLVELQELGGAAAN